MSDDIPASAKDAVYEAMSQKTVYSSFNRAASALEKLSENTKALTAELKTSNETSTRLTRSLNRLTLAAVVIAALALEFEVVKWV
jgi:hypothetical protein